MTTPTTFTLTTTPIATTPDDFLLFHRKYPKKFMISGANAPYAPNWHHLARCGSFEAPKLYPYNNIFRSGKPVKTLESGKDPSPKVCSG